MDAHPNDVRLHHTGVKINMSKHIEGVIKRFVSFGHCEVIHEILGIA